MLRSTFYVHVYASFDSRFQQSIEGKNNRYLSILSIISKQNEFNEADTAKSDILDVKNNQQCS